MTIAARLYCGDWIGDCTRPGCCNAEHLYDLRSPGHPPGPNNPRSEKRSMFHCSNCQLLDQIEWPEDSFMAAVAMIVSRRPVPQTRNWFPAEHPQAVRNNLEHGQTVLQLLEENAEHGVN